ncbi:DNA primase large subunit PriL [Candidatus Bathyarchaeota archaeon]|jgi:DNA primase large subunit|nr:DNA primase large subunit PriL [Candidatus Bathyarchaeota archaeon]MBT4321057.1 DNA primase large subunit PriL [Candidatus Bathyarchaeota archaeon]MBT4423795.1 DNA primase large subunit PriL [Candidatus Bathyarchaeota archaeon]MBT5642948.1 DNA primase large subunit PriL [Candidatus Bathyarchaeota archaeon]MBT7186813.1 DNA primase large subunit PriL [Candidatus Bathyarchaeota archaeon]
MLAEREAAKYPFLKEGLILLEGLNFGLEELAGPAFSKVVDRAKDRVIEAIVSGEASSNIVDPQTELLSYPIAVMYVTLVSEQFLNRRFSLSEAVRAYSLLQKEDEVRILDIAINEFDWDIKEDIETIDGDVMNLKLSFSDYLRLAAGFHEPKWKLVNRKMENGYVALTDKESARLMQVEVEKWVNERVATPSDFPLPLPLQTRLDEIRKVFEENRSKLGGSALPDEVINEAFPPCINYCLEGLMAGKRASHMERFALTTFLVNIGMPIDQMVSFYTEVTDFDESKTRYQIEHIAGLKGNRTKYTPPTCNTLRTHRVCRNPDRICDRINHPLSYYRRKIWGMQRRAEEDAARQAKEEAETSNKATKE